MPTLTPDGTRVVAGTDPGEAVVGVSAENGDAEWSRRLGAPVPVATAATDEAVFAASMRSGLIRLEAETGAVEWRVRPRGDWVAGPPVHAGGQVIIGTGADGGTVGRLECRSAADGGRRWRRRLPAAVDGAAAVTDALVLAADQEGRLHCLDRSTGERHWTRAPSGELSGLAHAPTVVDDGVLFVGPDGAVHRLRWSGGEWRDLDAATETTRDAGGDTVVVPPVVVGRGVLLAGSSTVALLA